MTKFEALERQSADYDRITGKAAPVTPWQRNEDRIIASLDRVRALSLRHRRLVLKSGHR